MKNTGPKAITRRTRILTKTRILRRFRRCWNGIFPVSTAPVGVLDFAAGGGEVTQVLRRLGAPNLMGCDPFTHTLFAKNTGLPCLQLAFKDVIRQGLPGTYSMIVSSFALHLCPPKDLFPLTWQLLQAAPLLVVLTPHKRPELENLTGIELAWQDFVTTERGKQVRLKAYRLA